MLINLELYQNFDEKIETIVESYDVDYIDAVLDYCSRNNLEIDAMADVIQKSPLLKSKIQEEAEKLHFLKPTARLPV